MEKLLNDVYSKAIKKLMVIRVLLANEELSDLFSIFVDNICGHSLKLLLFARDQSDHLFDKIFDKPNYFRNQGWKDIQIDDIDFLRLGIETPDLFIKFYDYFVVFFLLSENEKIYPRSPNALLNKFLDSLAITKNNIGMSEIPICRYTTKGEILHSTKNKISHVAYQYGVKTQSHNTMPKKYSGILNKIYMIHGDLNILKNEGKDGLSKMKYIKNIKIPKDLYTYDLMKVICSSIMYNLKVNDSEFLTFEIENEIKLKSFKIIK